MTKRPRTRLVSRRNNLLWDGDVEHEVALLQLNLADILLLRFGRRCNALKVSTMVLIVVRLLVRLAGRLRRSNLPLSSYRSKLTRLLSICSLAMPQPPPWTGPRKLAPPCQAYGEFPPIICCC